MPQILGSRLGPIRLPGTQDPKRSSSLHQQTQVFTGLIPAVTLGTCATAGVFAGTLGKR